MLKFLILLFGALLVCGEDILPQPGECGALNSEYFYNQKTVAELDEFPWMGRILYTPGPPNTCLAVLISKQYMLANAHCLILPRGMSTKPTAVVLGEWNKANNVTDPDCDESGQCAPVPRVYEIEEYVVHQKYNAATRTNDLAMIRLAEPVDYSNYIRPICLPSQEVSQMDFVAQHLQITGWRKHASITNKTKNFSQIMSSKECEVLLKDHLDSDVFKSHICAYTCDVQNHYTYLSGSALMGVATVQAVPDYYYLVALEAFGDPKCPSSVPSILIRVDGYLEWIKENMK